MQTILVILDSEKLENPDLDICYELPDKVEKYTNNQICDNGYDYLTDSELGIWLAANSAEESYGKVIEVFENHMVCGNDLAGTAKVYISTQEDAPLEECILVYDGEVQIPDEAMRVENRVQKVKKIIIKLVNLITNDDKKVTDTLERKLKELEDREEIWECATETLREYRYICKCDVDMGFDKFLEYLQEMPVVHSKKLSVNVNKSEAGDELYDWCEALDAQWVNTEYYMAMYELEDESEIVFPCTVGQTEEIRELAKEICVSIEAAAGY